MQLIILFMRLMILFMRLMFFHDADVFIHTADVLFMQLMSRCAICRWMFIGHYHFQDAARHDLTMGDEIATEGLSIEGDALNIDIA